MKTVVRVPKTAYRNGDVSPLCNLRGAAQDAALRSEEIVLDFSSCEFFNQSGVAFLGALIREAQSAGCRVSANVGTLDSKVRINLRKNGFLEHFGLDAPLPIGNSIPFREDRIRDDEGFVSYLLDDWLRRGWVDVSDQLSASIASSVFEIYANSFDHAGSPEGVFSCGQHYPNRKVIGISIVDFGHGIPSTVRSVPSARHLSDTDAILWALERGNSSKPLNRGMGLDLLRDFVLVNSGEMHIVSGSGHVSIGATGDGSRKQRPPFAGTLIEVLLNEDESRYVLRTELADDVLF